MTETRLAGIAEPPAATTQPGPGVRTDPRPHATAGPRRPPRTGPDRVTVALASLTAFLLVLALLASQLSPAGATGAAARATLVRRIYRTTVVERVLPAGSPAAANGSSVTQSVSATGGEPLPTSAPITRTS